MSSFSCAAHSQQAKETLVATASHHSTFVFIECPLPWPSKALTSKYLSADLQRYMNDAPSNVRFLCMHSGQKRIHLEESKQSQGRSSDVTLLIYCQPHAILQEKNYAIAPNGQLKCFINRYEGYEFRLSSLEDVLPCLRQHLDSDGLIRSASSSSLASNASDSYYSQKISPSVQDIFVCTHGMRDRCCARLGQPFFREVKNYLHQSSLLSSASSHTFSVPSTAFRQIRLWKVSHIGGHRFAPTAILFPYGRYYGRLNISAMRQLLHQQGETSAIANTYRGWSLLPRPVQVLEHHLFKEIGWSWLEREVRYEWQTATPSGDSFQVVLTTQQVKQGKQGTVVYRARIVRDLSASCTLRASCNQQQAIPIIKYAITDCVAQVQSPTEAPSRADANALLQQP